MNRNRKVKVLGRFRPTAHFAHDCMQVLTDTNIVNVHLQRDPRKGIVNNQIVDWSFKLDGLFQDADQETVYDKVASDIVAKSVDGFNGTIMAYGQTGAGKTFTMTGATESYQHRGIIPRAISQLFRQIQDKIEHSITVRISYLEIYNEGMFDLLSRISDSSYQSNKDISMAPDPMVITENQDGVFVKGLTCHLAQNEEDALNLLFEGETNRSIAAHQLNKHSSRSHCIFTVYLESRSRVQSDAKYTVSKVNFVDLAGSERLGKSKSEGKVKEEALYINKSLSFLEQVVIALGSKNHNHIPFRQSKLTHYLKDSIGGRCNTLLVANMWGERQQLEETVSTLRFATRMMCIASEPTVNEHYDSTLLVKRLRKEVSRLKAELAMHNILTNRIGVKYDPLSEQQRYDIKQKIRDFISGDLEEIEVVNLRQIEGTFQAFKDLYLSARKEVEEKLRMRYTLIDKRDPSALAAAQQEIENTKEVLDSARTSEAGLLPEEGSHVGDLDGGGYGVGSAPKGSRADQNAVVQLKKKEKERERKRGSKSPLSIKPSGSPDGSAKEKPESPTGTVKEEGEEVVAAGSPVSSAANLGKEKRSNTPPSRTSAFEEFKHSRGSEINRVLVENKEILVSKKRLCSDLARQVNQYKFSIDETRKSLEYLRLQREAEGPALNEDGDIIISEDEFMEIQKLRELKQHYRKTYDDLHKVKSEIVYCQKLVDQCRLRLITEFDNWYTELYLGQNDEQKDSLALDQGLRQGIMIPLNSLIAEDEQEKFERIQMELMMTDPESAAFYNAKMRTEKRKLFGYPKKNHGYKPPGTPTMSVRNKPPNMLQVQY